MTGLAITTKVTAMFVVAPVTGDTGRRCVFMVGILVASAALYIKVLAHQRVFCLAVIEPHLLPAFRNMAGTTIFAQ